jgi:hypothetical protein
MPNNGVDVSNLIESLIMPSVTVNIPMPPGAAVPVQSNQQNAPSQPAADASSTPS